MHPFFCATFRKKSLTNISKICFEVAQLFFGRSFDVDDLICNFIGIIIGAMVAYLILKTKSTDVPKGR